MELARDRGRAGQEVSGLEEPLTLCVAPISRVDTNAIAINTLNILPAVSIVSWGILSLPSECTLPGLCPELLGQAFGIFLKLAYPEGEGSIPAGKRAYLAVSPELELEILLKPPVCQLLTRPEGGIRGYAFRLGSHSFPHLKLQIVGQGDQELVFSVDTHDQVRIDPKHPDAFAWAELQTANRRLKEEIERAWEAAGLLTFNALLRRELQK
jgi:hypothetical protein